MNNDNREPKRPSHPDPKPVHEDPDIPRKIPVPPDYPDQAPVEVPPDQPNEIPIREPKKTKK